MRKRIISLLLATATVLCLVISLPVAAASRMVGDLDGNGRIGAADISMIKKVIIGVSSVEDSRIADLNSDERINAADVLLLKKALIGDFAPPVIEDENTADIADYTVVLSADAGVCEKYAAEILQTRVAEIAGVSLAISETSTDSEKEILIGASAAQSRGISLPELKDNQFTLFAENGKIVLDGCGYMVGGAVGELCSALRSDGKLLSDQIPATAFAADYAPTEATGFILMIGDGMGFNHVAFTNTYVARQSSWQYDYSGFTAQSFPYKGECTTVSASEITDNGTFKATVTDSAASATALATGWKTQNKKLGINLFGASVQNVRELAASKGLKTAVVTTEATTGATPSAFTVHNVSRSNIEEIAAAQNALAENGEITYLKGNLPGDHDLLAETKTALGKIADGKNGFFAMIEEAYIDKSCDRSYETQYTRKDTAKFVCRFDEAIEYAATFTAAYPGTVLVVTADHETGALSAKTGDSTNNGAHTDLNVPVYVLGYGGEQFDGAVTDNVKIARYAASVFGADTFGMDIDLTPIK